MAVNCIICENIGGNTSLEVKELQLGLNENFTYQLCKECGSLQLLDPPTDLSKYYPNENYYSFQRNAPQLTDPGLLRLIKTKYLLYKEQRLAGALLTTAYKEPEYYGWMRHARVKLNDKILDVGCGTGDLLRKLHKMGFKDLTGIDPFIDKEIKIGPINIYKKDIFSMDGKYDLVMMHHALEHMPDPISAMQKARELLNRDKYLLVRIPVMGNYGWKTYREYWSGIDAPRHMFIPSEKGMLMLASKTGYSVDHIEYDSTDYMIWSSEQYRNGISLYDKRSYMVNRKDGFFSKKQVKKFRKKMQEENKNKHADTAAFYLRKTGTI